MEGIGIVFVNGLGGFATFVKGGFRPMFNGVMCEGVQEGPVIPGRLGELSSLTPLSGSGIRLITRHKLSKTCPRGATPSFRTTNGRNKCFNLRYSARVAESNI